MNKLTNALKGSILVIISLSIVFTVFADDDTVGTYNIGIGAGFVTGYGLSYRQWFHRNGLQATITPYYYKQQNSKNSNLSFGLTGLHIFNQAKYINLIGYAGAHFWYYYSESQYNNYTYNDPYATNPTYTPVKNIEKDKKLFIGAGPGFDFHMWKISCNIMFGIAYQTNFGNTAGITPTGEAGAYYSF
jgi:hypothetical protein